MKLVFIENNRPVTDSLMVADTFSKRHDVVLRDIREVIEKLNTEIKNQPEITKRNRDFALHNFVETPYDHPSNGQSYTKVVMTEEAFNIVVMGFTGVDAMSYKVAFVSEFKRLRSEIENRVEVLSERKALIQSLRLTAELADEMEEIKDITLSHGQKIMELETKVDEQITLDSGDQRKVQKAVSRKVYAIESDAQLRSQLFRQLHREIKDRWAVPSYKDIRKHEMDGLMNYIEAWRPIAA